MKIPKHAKRVFKGIIYNVYHWKQKTFNGGYATFEGLKRRNTCQVIALLNGKIVVCEHKLLSHPGEKIYGLPGGRQDTGEKPLETAKRELLEETGLSSSDWKLFKTLEPRGEIDHSVFVFIARNCRKTAQPKQDSSEKIKHGLLSFNKFLALVKTYEFQDFEFKHELQRQS
ncbi:MAG: NUDIX hydrolase, partial [Candidatus Micrarchaeota archaeon]